jgi:hypothetical protein
MTLSLPLLINWARQTLWYYYDLRSKTRSNLQKSFETAAYNAWLAACVRIRVQSLTLM